MTRPYYIVRFTDLNDDQGWSEQFTSLTVAAQAAVGWRLAGGTATIFDHNGERMAA